jgi:hypothetical protein
MKDAVKRTSDRWVFAGLALQAGALVTISMVDHPSPAGFAAAMTMVAGVALFAIGLGMLARARGHHALWGLAGVVSLFGWVLVLMLPDRE